MWGTKTCADIITLQPAIAAALDSRDIKRKEEEEMMRRKMRRSGTMEVGSRSKTVKHYIEPPPSPIFPISHFSILSL